MLKFYLTWLGSFLNNFLNFTSIFKFTVNYDYSHRNDDDEENPQEEESTSTNDNPLDPEEIERRRYSKMVQEQGFSKILSINEGTTC